MLRLLLCWEWEDVLFFVTNERADREPLSEKLTQEILAWNKFDNAIFEHFNKTFWRKIDAYEHFESDKKTLEKLLGTCRKIVYS